MYLPRKSYTLDQALSTLKRYCAYQDRCHTEVERKLTEMRMIPQAKDEIIISLIENDYLNEERFALTFVKGKFRIKKWGRIRLRAELKKRKVSKYLIKSALQQISDVDYLASFEELANNKAPLIKAKSNLLKRKKLADYLIYRGWESTLVYDKVNQLF